MIPLSVEGAFHATLPSGKRLRDCIKYFDNHFKVAQKQAKWIASVIRVMRHLRAKVRAGAALTAGEAADWADYQHMLEYEELTDDMIVLLVLYTMGSGEGSFYWEVNRAMWAGARRLGPWSAVAQQPLLALDKLPPHERTLYRGLSCTADIALIERGVVHVWTSVTSCTATFDKVQGFVEPPTPGVRQAPRQGAATCPSMT